MSFSRKSLAWLVLATYLSANTLTASLHDHRECSGHCAGVKGPHSHHHHAGHCHVGHDHHRHDTRKELRAPHHCLVCEFFAQAPLTPPATGLVLNCDLLPNEWQPPVPLLAQAAATTHLARGPPALA